MSFAITDDNQEIYYEVHGSTGPILVFISGYMGITNIWHPLISRLKSKYRCIAYDSRGFGRSSKPESTYSIPRHAADLEAVVKAGLQAIGSDGESAVLITHSMGGNIASSYYLNSNKKNVSGIIYTATYYDGKLVDEKKLLTVDALVFGADQPSKCVEFYTNMGLDADIAIEAAKWPVYARTNNGKALIAFDIDYGYTRINVPSLIVQGELDMATPVDECVKPMERALPACRLEVLKGVKHFPPTEAPKEMESLIDGFVQDLH